MSGSAVSIQNLRFRYRGLDEERVMAEVRDLEGLFDGR